MLSKNLGGFTTSDNRVDGRVHLPRRSPVVFDSATLSLFFDPAIEVGETVVEKRIHVSFNSTMRVKLDEEIVANNRSNIKPLPDAIARRHVVARNLARFNARYKTAFKA